MTDYDAIIVGGGPAGLMTAKTCAENGLDVCILEKDAEIGAPKRCAEGISMHGFERSGLKASPKFVAKKMKGANLYTPSGKVVEIRGDKPLGYVLERKIFEKHLAKEAIKAGSDCMVRTTVTELLKDKGRISGVKADYMGDMVDVTSNLIIACDGVEAKVGRMAGINTTAKMGDFISGFQYEMANMTGIEDNLIHMFFGNEVTPRGYLWFFPKGDDLCNVGIGILGTENMKNTARFYLEKFIKNNPAIFKDAAPVEVNSGGVPVSGFLQDSFVADNFMMVGDSAQMVNPIHGGGMSTNLYAAQIAGRVASEAIKEDNLSKEKLFEYEKEWRDTDGVRMAKLLKLRHFSEKLSDSDFELMAKILTGENLMDMQKAKFKFMLKAFFRHPKLLNLARKFLF